MRAHKIARTICVISTISWLAQKLLFIMGVNTRPQERQSNKEGKNYGRKTQHGPDGPGVHGL